MPQWTAQGTEAQEETETHLWSLRQASGGAGLRALKPTARLHHTGFKGRVISVLWK